MLVGSDGDGREQFGVRVALADGREAIWRFDAGTGLQAHVLLGGMRVGVVPPLAGSADLTDDAFVGAIAGADYDPPLVRRSGTMGAAAAHRRRGVFGRLRRDRHAQLG